MFFTRGVNLRFRTVVIKKLSTILKPKTVIWMENRLGNRNFEMAKLFIQPLKRKLCIKQVVLKTIVGSFPRRGPCLFYLLKASNCTFINALSIVQSI